MNSFDVPNASEKLIFKWLDWLDWWIDCLDWLDCCKNCLCTTIYFFILTFNFQPLIFLSRKTFRFFAQKRVTFLIFYQIQSRCSLFRDIEIDGDSDADADADSEFNFENYYSKKTSKKEKRKGYNTRQSPIKYFDMTNKRNSQIYLINDVLY